MHVPFYHVINEHLTDVIKTSIFSNNMYDMIEGGEDVIIYLDFHASMIVFRKYCCIINLSVRYTNVNDFTPDLNAVHRVPVCDATIAYDYPYILVGHNISHVSLIEMKLIPMFILRKTGLEIQDVP